jgi:Putative DNA-binding domain
MSASFEAFADALHVGAGEPPQGLFRTANPADAAARLAVYRNNVWSSLVRALEESFPVVQALVGAEFFAGMAREFIKAHPPTSPVLSQYGGEFGAFIGAFAPAAELPYLADVARLEWARIQAYHSADVEPLPLSTFAAQLVRPAALQAAFLGLHPGAGIVRSAHPIVAIWAAHQGAQELADIAPTRAENALVFRARDEPNVHSVSHAVAGFIEALLHGQPLGEAAATGTATQVGDAEPFDLSWALAFLIEHQLICAWSASG